MSEKKIEFIELHRCEVGDTHNADEHVSCHLCYDGDYEVYLHCQAKGAIECLYPRSSKPNWGAKK